MPFWRPRGCVLWLDFLEPSGSVAYDKSGYGNHGTVHGAQRVRSLGRWGLEFDGVDDYVEVPDSPSLDSVSENNALTIIVLVKWDVVPTSDMEILEKHNNIFGLWHDDGKYLAARLTSEAGGWHDLRYEWLPKPGRWYLIAFTFDGVTRALWINGERVASAEEALKMGASDYPLYIGTYDARINWHDGVIALVHIYNRALTADEIKANYTYFFSHLKGEV